MTDANAVRHFQDKLTYETSPREVVTAIKNGEKLTIVDVRRPEAYAKGHILGSINIEPDALAAARGTLDAAQLVVVYDWGPASTDSSRAALALASMGFRVRELIGGFEYWMRMGLGIEGPDGVVKRRVADPLVTTATVGWD